MAHLLGVAALVMGEADGRIPVTEDMAVAALLHDTVEDHGGLPRLKDVEARFGVEVAMMVAGLSDTFAEDHDKKEDWEEREKAYIGRLKYEDLDVQLISIADKLYNARAILDDYRVVGMKVFERFKRGAGQQLGNDNSTRGRRYADSALRRRCRSPECQPRALRLRPHAGNQSPICAKHRRGGPALRPGR
jgi:(p)ppGpp synthase/HD superfamily hydrolase